MAFNLDNFSRQSLAYNTGAITVNSVLVNGPAIFSYRSASDDVATVGGANYFADAVFELSLHDLIFCVCSDASTFYQVSAIDRDAGTISVVSAFPSGMVGTANIQNGAVTAPKIDDDAVTTAKILDANVTSAKLAADTVQYVAVDISAADWNGMYAAPVELVAAPAAGFMHVVEKAVLAYDHGSQSFADGGDVAIQYDDTVNGAGELASAVFSATTINGWSADSALMADGALASAALADVAAVGLYLSNVTQAFATGDGSFKLHLWYKTVEAL